MGSRFRKLRLRSQRRFGRVESVLPGFGLTLGVTILFLTLIVMLPLSLLFFSAAAMPLEEFWKAVSSPRALAAFKLTFGVSLLAALVNLCAGTIVAWVLVRYRFPGRAILDAMVDLPFALPTAVAGIALTAMYAKTGMLGSFFDRFGIPIAFTWAGVFVALVFVGFPFIVRTLQPTLEDLNLEMEEAAITLGASRLQTITRIVLPALVPSLLSGFSLAFARGLGEYGSVIFISGNLPMRTEIVPLLIMNRLDTFDYPSAAALAVVMMVIAFLILLALNLAPGAAKLLRRRSA